MGLRNREEKIEERKERREERGETMSVRVFFLRFYREKNVSRILGFKLSLFYFLFFALFLIISCGKKIATFNDSQVFRYNEHSNIT